MTKLELARKYEARFGQLPALPFGIATDIWEARVTKALAEHKEIPDDFWYSTLSDEEDA